MNINDTCLICLYETIIYEICNVCNVKICTKCWKSLVFKKSINHIYLKCIMCRNYNIIYNPISSHAQSKAIKNKHPYCLSSLLDKNVIGYINIYSSNEILYYINNQIKPMLDEITINNIIDYLQFIENNRIILAFDIYFSKYIHDLIIQIIQRDGIYKYWCSLFIIKDGDDFKIDELNIYIDNCINNKSYLNYENIYKLIYIDLY